MNTRIDFPTAKLLKEKGFDEECKLCIEDGDERPLPFNCGNTMHRNSLHSYYSAPTIVEVIMWLYEKHGIWIVVNPHKGEDDLGKPFMEFNPEVWSFTNECVYHNTNLLYFNSPTEAYITAIKYTLENLIP